MSDESQMPRGGSSLPSESELLREARSLLPRVDSEPRPGFAARVALRAAEQHQNRPVVSWWRWIASGGTVLLAGTAALLITVLPHAHHPVPETQPGFAQNDLAHGLLRAAPGDVAMAQKLELYEELTLVQNEDALEDIEVVAALNELRPEAKP